MASTLALICVEFCLSRASHHNIRDSLDLLGPERVLFGSDQTLLSVADSSSMSVQALLPVELFSKTLLNRRADVVYLKKSYVGRVVAIDRQVSMGDNNHPAMYVQIKFQTDGSLPAGLPVKISIEDD